MTQLRYRGAKIATVQTGSGRWLAHSGYGDADGNTEAEAVAGVKRKISAELAATKKRDAAQSAKIQAWQKRGGHIAHYDRTTGGVSKCSCGREVRLTKSGKWVHGK